MKRYQVIKKMAITFWSVFLCINVIFGQSGVKVNSPDGKLVFSFVLNNDGQPEYSVQYAGKDIVYPSAMGLDKLYPVPEDKEKRGYRLGEVVSSEKDTTWKPVYGERSLVHDNYKGVVVSLIKKDNERRPMQLEVRAYNEGIAFRYVIPEYRNQGSDYSLQYDLTEFTLPEGTQAWYTPRAQSKYQLLPLKNWPGESERPLVLQLPGGLYACLGEAALVDFSRTKFVLDDKKANTIRCSMYGQVDLISPFSTPWRVVMVAEKPGQLLENNDLFLNLNEPCKIPNTSWIKPGKVMREITLSTKGAKELIDFAVQRNLQYVHFDAGWYGHEYSIASDATKVNVDPLRNPVNDLDLEAMIRYADGKGVGVILYVNQRALAKQLDELLPLFKKWGVRGLKFGFVHVGSHRWTVWLHEAIKKCADYGLMVDVHDEYRPTGFSRTYPNFMTQEGIMGNEAFPEADHNTILPFTRFVAGAADYTICYYRQDFGQKGKNENGVPRERFLKTTPAHQLALAAIYYSPWQYMYWYDKPSDYQNEPEIEFFDHVPTVWDDTKVIQGEIGQYITVARRSGEEWFIGSITNNNTRELKIPLTFLTKGIKYEARVYEDDPSVKTRTHVAIVRKNVDSSTVLSAKLKNSGGQAVWIKPVPCQ